MNLQQAKARRLEAIRNRGGERVLVKPAAHPGHVKLPDEGTVADYLIEVLYHGCTTDEIEAETGWSRSTAMINLYKVAKKSGVGIRRNGDMLHLILPKGSRDLYPRTRLVAAGNTVRSMAAEVVILNPET